MNINNPTPPQATPSSHLPLEPQGREARRPEHEGIGACGGFQHVGGDGVEGGGAFFGGGGLYVGWCGRVGCVGPQVQMYMYT